MSAHTARPGMNTGEESNRGGYDGREMRGRGTPQEVVERGYDEVADAYAALEAEGDEWPRMRHLRELLSSLSPGGHVLDLGCGNGVPTMAAIQERHQGVGVDISAAQIARARTNVPGATFMHEDMSGVDFGDASLDAIVSFYAIEHVPREGHPQLFAKFYRWLRPGGRLLFTLEAGGDEPGRMGKWLNVEMFFSYYDVETTTALLQAAGFRVERAETESQLEGGRLIEYEWFHARKPLAKKKIAKND
jgi:cyclopropane fatty-acyl-phospholipid synthase-like methyltransferase